MFVETERRCGPACQDVRVSVFGGNKSISLSPALSLLQAACAKLQKHSLVIPCDWNFLSVSLVLNTNLVKEPRPIAGHPWISLANQSSGCLFTIMQGPPLPSFLPSRLVIVTVRAPLPDQGPQSRYRPLILFMMKMVSNVSPRCW